MKTFVVGSHGKTRSLPGVPLPKSTPKKVLFGFRMVRVNMGLVVRKRDFVPREQQRGRPACAMITKADQHLCYSISGKFNISTSRKILRF